MGDVDSFHLLLGAAAAVGGVAIVLGGLFLSLRVQTSDDPSRNAAIGKAVALTSAFAALVYLMSVLSYW